MSRSQGLCREDKFLLYKINPGTILAGKNPRFLLGISMRHRNKIYPNGHVLYVDGGILAYIGKQV